jgi:hypothetical protein
MIEHQPDKWVIIKIQHEDSSETYKIFGCWYGGYLGSDSWKMNSGIVSVTDSDQYWLFHGVSGSVYRCFKKAYGMHMYGSGVLQKIIDNAKKSGIMIEVISKDIDWVELFTHK